MILHLLLNVCLISITLTLQASFTYAESSEYQYTKKELEVPLPSDYVLGCENAPDILIEYASYVCPHCSYYHANIFPSVKRELIDTCKIKYIYREYPAKQAGLDAAIISRCGAINNESPKAFYDFVTVLFATQKNWAFDIEYREKLKEISKLQGISEQRFEECLKRKEIGKQVINVVYHTLKHFDIQEIPFLMINGHRIEDNDLKAIQNALEKYGKKNKRIGESAHTPVDKSKSKSNISENADKIQAAE